MPDISESKQTFLRAFICHTISRKDCVTSQKKKLASEDHCQPKQQQQRVSQNRNGDETKYNGHPEDGIAGRSRRVRGAK